MEVTFCSGCFGCIEPCGRTQMMNASYNRGYRDGLLGHEADPPDHPEDDFSYSLGFLAGCDELKKEKDGKPKHERR